MKGLISLAETGFSGGTGDCQDHIQYEPDLL